MPHSIPTTHSNEQKIIQDGRRNLPSILFAKGGTNIYIYPENLRAKAMLWLWPLRDVAKRVCAMSTTVKLDRLNNEVPQLIEQYRSHLHWGRFDQAMDCMEQASALAAAACRRELRQLGMAATEEEVAGALCERIRPHRNRGSLKNRYRVLAPQFQSVLALEDAAGLRTQEEKKTLAGRWLDLAAAFAGVPIQYEAEQMKQREAQSTLNMELGVTL